MSQLYDLMLMLDTRVDEEQRAKVLADIKTMVGAQGTIEGDADWGVRALAYEIDHHGDADYHFLQFSGTPALLEQLHHQLRITDGVLRARIIKRRRDVAAPAAPAAAPAPGAPAAAAPRAADPAAEPVGEPAA